MGARDGLLRSSLLRVAVVALAACGHSADPGDPAVAGSGAGPSGPDLEVRADPGLQELARSVTETRGVWTSMPGIPDSVLAGRRVVVWFARDLSTLDSVGLGRPEPWVAGVADPGRRRIALGVAGSRRNLDRLLAVYRHEAAHVALHAATGGNVPRWLHEGYAQMASGTWDWREGWRLQFTLMRGGHSILSDLDRRFRTGLEPRTAYILSYTAVDALRALGGEAGLEALFQALHDGDRLDTALRRVYGLTADQFERRWRARVLDRYGWLYLLSRTGFVWLAVTFLVIGLGIARLRHDRRRLAEMRERERREAALERTDVDGPPRAS
ncbi:MAG: peptidase MA family metallohydrolase [Gemmatimonadota bacterium]